MSIPEVFHPWSVVVHSSGYVTMLVLLDKVEPAVKAFAGMVFVINLTQYATIVWGERRDSRFKFNRSQSMERQITVLRPLMDSSVQQSATDLMRDLSHELEAFGVDNREIEFLQHIGSGGSSQVWKVSIRGEILAAKKLSVFSAAGLKQFRDECQLQVVCPPC